MSVTITRSRVIELGEKVIQDARKYTRETDLSDSAPEVVGFRRILANSYSLARGTNEHGGVTCPMIQAGFDLNQSDAACHLAISWDRFTREADLALDFNKIININPS
jgi:hypothetical protein